MSSIKVKNYIQVLKEPYFGEIEPYMLGLCGVFAIAISIIKPGGNILEIADNQDKPFSKDFPYCMVHSVYKIHNEYCDATGVYYNKTDILNNTKKYLGLKDIYFVFECSPKRYITLFKNYPAFSITNKNIKEAILFIKCYPTFYKV